MTRGDTILRKERVFEIKQGNGEISFSISFPVQIPHKPLFVRGHSGLLSRWPLLQTDSNCVHWFRTLLVGQRLEGPRAHWVALGRSKGQWVAPERTQVAQGNVQEEQGRRTKGVLACASKDAKSSTSNHSNSSSHYLNQQPT